MTLPVLFVGAFSLDTLYTVRGFSAGSGKYLSDSRVCTASGMATTAATAAVRLGGRASLWASVGDDAVGDAIIAEIAEEGVDCSHIRRVANGRTANATILVDEHGERWVVVDYDPLTQAPPSPSDLPPMSEYSAVMADVRWPGAAQAALTAARDAGRIAVFDADVAESATLSRLAACATHVVASEKGASILADTTDMHAAARWISAEYGCFTCITCGANGSLWTGSDAGMVHAVPTPQVQAVDTNAAGDVFHGAFTQALAEGQTEEQAIRFASAAAALKCTVVGGRLGAPNRADTLELMNGTYR
ncbi:PfkB family carbohydrate kinase [Amaricoccus tamworthensis]|uniref:PfkB family carbohydrate kinase n=1 Tax=Amaricoccus tamworthensis TaxID=57002 RepID=UPI003C7CCD56